MVPEHLEAVCIEVNKIKSKPTIVTSLYRPPNSKIEIFDSIENLIENLDQPRTQALSTTRLAGGKTLVQAGHVSPRFWEITIGTYRGYREGKCCVRVQNNTRSVNKATQRTVP